MVKSHGGERCGNVGTKIPAGTVAEQVEDQIDARPGRDRLADCIPMLEQAFASWQDNGAAANFALVVAAVTPPRSRYLPGRRLAQR